MQACAAECDQEIKSRAEINFVGNVFEKERSVGRKVDRISTQQSREVVRGEGMANEEHII